MSLLAVLHRFIPVLVLLLAQLVLLATPNVAIASANENRQKDLNTVSIGVVADNEPYSSFGANGTEGFSIDVLNEIGRISGLKMVYRVGSWSDIFAAFQRGELDAVDEISWREDRAKKMLFTRPYHIRQTIVMHDTRRPLPPINSLEDLKPFRVGSLKDIYYSSVLQEAGLETTEYSLQPEMVQALSFGWIDAIIGPEVTLNYFARQKGFVNLEVASPAPLNGQDKEDFRIAVALDQPDLHTKLDNALGQIDPQWLEKLRIRWQEFGGRPLSSTQFELSPSQKATIRQQGPLRVGLMRDYAPLSFDNEGKVQGLTVDVLSRIADLTGVRIVPVVDQWHNLIELFKRGEIDVMANISDSPERRSFARFTAPYHYVSVVGFSRSPDKRLNSTADLEGLKVGYGTGIFYEDALKQHVGDNAIAFSDQASMFIALQNGQVDLVLAALDNGNHWLREMGLYNLHIAGELVLSDQTVREDLRFAFRSELEPLVPIFNNALSAIAPAQMRVIENRWLGAALINPASTNTITLTETEQAYLESQGHKLVFCANSNWMPLQGVSGDGAHTGLASDLLNHLSERLSVEFEHYPTQTWPEALQALTNGQCDLLPAVPASDTLDKNPNITLTEAYYTLPTVVLGRIESPFFRSVTELHGKPIGVSNHAAWVKDLNLQYPGLDLTQHASEQDGLRKVQNGELYGYVGTLATTSLLLQELEINDVRVIGRIPMDTSLAIAVNEKDPTLAALLEKALATLNAAERNEMESRWLALALEEKVDYTLLWKLLAVALVVFAVLVYWNRKLRRLNKELALANHKLAEISTTDQLTGLGNRTYFEQTFETLFDACRTTQTPYLVAMIDADHFKHINDEWGHEAGDTCLIALANILKSHYSDSNSEIVRFGGEEFVIFSEVSNEMLAKQQLEILRSKVENMKIAFETHTIKLTVSIGYCCAAPQANSLPQQWFRAADRALYDAKDAGRNRVMQRMPT
ncbi:MAG: diguanylate cyclase [Pusillimonas sp.]|nr:diguanylate cyclase [Pusillimonas sp.]